MREGTLSSKSVKYLLSEYDYRDQEGVLLRNITAAPI